MKQLRWHLNFPEYVIARRIWKRIPCGQLTRHPELSNQLIRVFSNAILCFLSNNENRKDLANTRES